MNDAAAPDRRSPSPAAILAVVGFSVFVAADDLTVVSTMLRPIIGDLGLVLPDGLDDAAWVVNAYLIAFVAIMPIAGRISDVLGRRRTFVGAYLTFLAGSILIPLSVSLDEPFGWFLFGRILTALGGGAMVPVALAVVGDVYPEGRRARALGTLGAIETMGWVWGPLYGAMLVRFLSWEWQFWLNIPLALAGLAASWWALAGHDRPEHGARIDWVGAALLTVTLVSLNMALLGSAEIQSVNGLDELTGGGGTDLRWLYPVAVIAGGLFAWQQRHSVHPLVDRRLFRGRTLVVALAVNFVVGAGLVIAMVDVPLFVNSIEVDLERAAVMSGWILSALTAAMAVASYVGGRWTERAWFRPPVLTGVAMSAAAYAWMGATWTADTSYPLFAVQLALLGAGFGLTVAPTTSAVVDQAPPDQRGAAAVDRDGGAPARPVGRSLGADRLGPRPLQRTAHRPSSCRRSPTPTSNLRCSQPRRPSPRRPSPRPSPLLRWWSAPACSPRSPCAVRARRETPTMNSTDDPFGPLPVRVASDTTRTDVAEGDDLGPDGRAVSDTARTLVAMQRRMNLMIGLLGLLLAGAFVTIFMLFGRVDDAQADAAAARAELDTARADLERVEAGAALYASQIQGFQDQLVALEPQISAGVDEAITGLRTFGDSTISFDVTIDEVIPIDTEVVIDRTVEVPIKTTIPINQSFDTTIRIDTPLGEVPVDVTVPVDVEVPVDLVVDIPINETVPIRDEFPVQLDVPISIVVRETELAELTDSLAAGLESLQDMLTGLGG